ncbi:MAG: SDR family NAD(P)-dependent oxidoreductase [Parvibaculaceae bacterium]|nr:SDR family NAD(P)-dependent oxidoreductase [Parvibaculaceae bacterium]
MDLGLKGLKAIVTGGTKGIGGAVAETFAREGTDVAICARSAADVEKMVAELQALGVRAIGRAVDVSDGDALQAWVRDVAAEFGGIDIVVGNVSALSMEDTEASWNLGFQIDLMHCVRMVDAAMPYLEQSKAASVVVISSVSGREVDAMSGPYGAFKAALVHYAKGLSFRYAGKGLRANAVSPGDTYYEGGVWTPMERDDPKLFAECLALSPIGRMAEPQEIANGIVFLSSPAASFINGTNLVIDGALTRGVQL